MQDWLDIWKSLNATHHINNLKEKSINKVLKKKNEKKKPGEEVISRNLGTFYLSRILLSCTDLYADFCILRLSPTYVKSIFLGP